MEYGLIGAKLGHSYSKIIHERLCDYTYDLHPLPTEEEARAFLAKKEFRAINVTIPYKKLVMEFCDVIDPAAASIGAVNTVVNRDGVLYGYNTDYAGFAALCQTHGITFAGKKVAILGTGGTSNTVKAVCTDAGAAQIFIVSRTPQNGAISYEDALTCGATIIINTTPAGMYPNVGTCTLDIASIKRLEAVVDAVYNPFMTELLLRATALGLPPEKVVNGFEMLVAQAVFAAEHFLSAPFPNALTEIKTLHSALKMELSNIILIGMPSCGKSTIGKQIADSLGKTFIDIDAEIEKTAGMPIPQIFEAEGEAGFRLLESAEIARFAKENRQVLSLGGGAVLRAENIRACKQNGVVLFIDRPLADLAVGGDRPLSTSTDALAKMETIRKPLYEAAADAAVRNNTSFHNVTQATLTAFRNLFD